MTTDASGSESPAADAEDPGTGGPAVAEADVDAKSHQKRKHLPVWQETILLLGIALVLAVVIKTFFVQAFYIPSESMEPGLVKNDRILVQKVSYWFGGEPQRGDVVVFEDPGGWLTGAEPAPTGVAALLSKVGLYPTGGHLVKRVIATEGDVVKCCDDEGRILVNGEPIDESEYLADDSMRCNAESKWNRCDWTAGPVPEGKLFVMGDNRGSSADSRVHMCSPDEDPCTKSPWVDEDLVVGKVFALVWPQDRWRWVTTAVPFADVPDAPPVGRSEEE